MELVYLMLINKRKLWLEKWRFPHCCDIRKRSVNFKHRFQTTQCGRCQNEYSQLTTRSKFSVYLY